MVKCVRIKKENAEKTRIELAKKNLINPNYAPMQNGEYVYFPLTKKVEGFEIVEKKLRKKELKPKSLRDALKGKLTESEIRSLVTSFDIVGDIAIIEVPSQLSKKEKLIADAIFKVHRNIKVVAKKISGTKGRYRIRPVKIILGEKRTHTVHKENGIELELDLNKVYFSPRLATERNRIASLIRGKEKVLVPFAGVGPFAITIAKKAPQAKIVGIELNPAAVEYFRNNVKRNDCTNVEVIQADVKKVLPGEYRGWADRIVMPLPKDAPNFLPYVLPCIKKGGILHYYSFENSKNPYEAAEDTIQKSAREHGKQASIIFRRIVRPYSKDIVQIVLDVAFC
ncbi:MAG: class I SAM-dependent methyltransferase family protein [Candidatus Micrarchaeota archaeon]|nr:class I SAM-dependent methyltransferase family protein [Candidatus Micrarchaeota archaeon]